MSKADEINKSIRIENIVASTAVGHEIDLNRAALVMGGKYDPEQFPGLVYHLDVPKAVVLLFGSGKLVIAGSKKPRDAETAVGHIVKELEGMALI